MTGNYLMFNGNCKQALEAYQKAFGIEVAEIQTYGSLPPNPDFPVSEDKKNLVLHARFSLDGVDIMCADAEDRAAAGENMYVSVTGDAAMIQKAWNCLKEGGKIYMDLQPTFFAILHGSLRDAFGINWMFSARQ